jgi:hypothetical protein
MNRLLVTTLALLCCCETPSKETVLPSAYEAEPDWVIYEGILPTAAGDEITVELLLKTGAPGHEAQYKLNEWSADHNSYMMGRSSSGLYTTLVGATPNEFIIQLHECKINQPLFFGEMTPDKIKEFREAKNRTDEVYFRTNDDKLFMLDENLHDVSAQKYSLIKRSKAFTVEGHVTFANDTCEFFEMNTRESWALSNRGMFLKAKARYYELAKEKYEGIYIRALAYSVNHHSRQGKNIDALVLRNIYEMRPGNPINSGHE